MANKNNNFFQTGLDTVNCKVLKQIGINNIVPKENAILIFSSPEESIEKRNL